MKNILKLLIAFLLISGTTVAQNLKFGHINFEELIDAMPEKDSALNQLQKEYTEAQNLIEEMTVEFNKKYMSVQQSYDTLSTIGKQMVEEELSQQQQRIQQYQMTAEQKLVERRESLLNPIIEKAQNSIKTVSKEQGFTYIFDVSVGSQVLYFSEKSIDVMPIVKKQLGIE